MVRLAIGIAVFAAILAAQARQIIRSELPELRAVQALGVVIPLFLVVFATVYLALSNASAGTFTEQLDHTRALYFTVTVFSTVGFGDITPKTDLARIIVSIQMLLTWSSSEPWCACSSTPPRPAWPGHRIPRIGLDASGCEDTQDHTYCAPARPTLPVTPSPMFLSGRLGDGNNAVELLYIDAYYRSTASPVYTAKELAEGNE